MALTKTYSKRSRVQRWLVFLGILTAALVAVTYPHWWIIQLGVSATQNGRPIQVAAHRRGGGLYLFHLAYVWEYDNAPIRKTYLVDTRAHELCEVDSPKQIVDAHFVAFSLDLPYPQAECLHRFAPKIEWDPRVVFADSSVSFEDWTGERFCLRWR